ncbi:MAG: hypothetical protein KF752_20215 [Pirellulaceae bacterium]|nr:hypothetical protein [Pirellulaceae bacterium]
MLSTVLTEAQFAAQQQSLGRAIHFHDGVWWERLFGCYCQPAFFFRAVTPKLARPAFRHSLLGYSHLTPAAHQANRSLTFMTIQRKALESFSLSSLPSKKRNQVRKAQEHCQVAKILDLEPWLEQMRCINIAQSLRQQRAYGAETPLHRFTKQAQEWRQDTRRQFMLEGRAWWGAFRTNRLIAYLRCHQVEDVCVIEQVRSDTDYHKLNPVDALYFHLLQLVSATESCNLIINGRPHHPSLNHFKQQFLFRPVEFPYYSSNLLLFRLGKFVRQQMRSISSFKITRDVRQVNVVGG